MNRYWVSGIAFFVILIASPALPQERSPHALHMPSHIFTRLGLWQESIDSNIAAAAAAKKHAWKAEQLHSMDYLEYAYLQLGQDKKGKAVIDELKTITAIDVPNFAAAYAFSAIAARYFLEKKEWKQASSLTLQPEWFPWEKFLYAQGNVYFARGLGAARSGNLESARKDLQVLRTIVTKLKNANDKYSAGQIEIQEAAVAGWLEFAEGNKEKALELMRSAADLEDGTDKHPVTPGSIVPARELLGQLLLELKRPGEALEQFERTLASAPSRLNTIYGAARSAELAGTPAKAEEYYARLVKLTKEADTHRPEIQEAKIYISNSR